MNPLAGRHRWLTNAGTVAVSVGVAIASAYAGVALDFPKGSVVPFLGILAVVSVSAVLISDAIEQRSLTSLRHLALGSLAPSEERLFLAAQEVMEQPARSFRLSFGFLAGGSLVVSIAWGAVTAVPLSLAFRVCLIGLALAPLAALLSELVSVPRARQVLRELVAAGLPAERWYRSAPMPFALRRRLAGFLVIAVATPLALIVDLTLGRLSALAAAPDAPLASAAGTSSLVVLVVLVVSVSAWLVGSNVGTPLRELETETTRLARGEHHGARFVPAEHETLAAVAALATMERELLGLVGQLGGAARGLTGATGQLSASSPPTARREEQRGALDATNATTSELAHSAQDIAVKASSSAERAKQTLEAARRGRASAEGFLGAMAEVRRGNQAIADSVVRLNKRVQQVGRIIEFINGIADKSDLLALNAELEGNKAGEVGRGFSLVAAEMRRLAESVMQSTREIAGLIDEIRDATNAAVMATEAGVKATDAGTALAEQVGEGLGGILEYADQSAEAMQRISFATAQQEQGTEQLVSAMRDILRSTEVSQVAAKDMQSAHAQLTALGRALEATVERFEVRS